MTAPGPMELHQQAEGDPQRFHDLMVEHGYILRPGDEGYEDTSPNLPCGWPYGPMVMPLETSADWAGQVHWQDGTL